MNNLIKGVHITDLNTENPQTEFWSILNIFDQKCPMDETDRSCAKTCIDIKDVVTMGKVVGEPVFVNINDLRTTEFPIFIEAKTNPALQNGINQLIEIAAVNNKGLHPEISHEPKHICLTCGTRGVDNPETSYCFICDTDNFEPIQNFNRRDALRQLTEDEARDIVLEMANLYLEEINDDIDSLEEKKLAIKIIENLIL